MNKKTIIIFILLYATCAITSSASSITELKKEALDCIANWIKTTPDVLEDSKKAEQFFIGKIDFGKTQKESLASLNSFFKAPPCNIVSNIKVDSESELTISIHYYKQGVGRFSVFYYIIFDKNHKIRYIKDGYGVFFEDK